MFRFTSFVDTKIDIMLNVGTIVVIVILYVQCFFACCFTIVLLRFYYHVDRFARPFVQSTRRTPCDGPASETSGISEGTGGESVGSPLFRLVKTGVLLFFKWNSHLKMGEKNMEVTKFH